MDRAFDKQMGAGVIRLHMEGVDSLDGDVRLGVFIEKLSALKAALSETDHLISGTTSSKVDFLVSELTHQSPAMVGLRATPVGRSDPQHPYLVVSRFVEYLNRVKSGDIVADSKNAKLFDHIRKLASGAGERFQRLWIDGPAIDAIKLDAGLSAALDSALPEVIRELGTVKGIVKMYSGVGKKLYFKIIPPVGGVEIKCAFVSSMLAEAASAVEHCATVEGELRYYKNDLWPHEVKVRKIIVHAADSELPTLQGLAGVAPRATGELSSEEFVRGLRDGW